MSENQSGMDSSACRKKRLKELLDLGGEIRLNKEVEDNVTTIEKISDIIKETDLINKKGDVNDCAQNTTEVVMDAQVIQMSHELIGEVIQKISNSEFSDEEWTNALVGIIFNDNTENWKSLEEVATKICHSVRFSSALGGSYDDEPEITVTQQKERLKRGRSNKADEVRPDSIDKVDKQDNNISNVMHVYKQILKIFKERKTPIPYYELITDPTDFMKTVDNSFQIAFLARDKSLSIDYGEDGPCVQPLSKQDKVKLGNETAQAICSLNPQLWRDMIEKYQIQEPLLKSE